MNALRARCPTCQREIAWSEAYPQRPFCSERCKLVDLGAWLSESHRIAGDEKSGTVPDFHVDDSN